MIFLPLEEYYDMLRLHLEERGVEGLQDPSTPTYEALEWLAFQDGSVQQLLATSSPTATTALEQQSPPHQQSQDVSPSIEQSLAVMTLDTDAVDQRYSLAVLFFSTAGEDFWDGEWLEIGVHECDFRGLTCESEEDGPSPGKAETFDRNRGKIVISMDLPQRSLLGTLPTELSWLTHLRRLDLRQNRLYGTLPPAVFQKMQKLEVLDLTFNEFSGTLPTDWSALIQLNSVSFESNAFSGPIPTKLPPNLKFLSLEQNQFSGTIPIREWALDHWPKEDRASVNSQRPSSSTGLALEVLDLSSNYQLGGSIASDIGIALPNLKSFGVFLSNVGGTLPSEMGLMPRLQELSLSRTQLTGTIPLELWSSTSLEWLQIMETNIGGKLPSELLPTLVGNHNSTDTSPRMMVTSKLKRLTLTFSSLTGSIPTEFPKLFPKLQWLQLSQSDLTGTIPSELGELYGLGKEFSPIFSRHTGISCSHHLLLFTLLIHMCVEKLWLHGTKLEGTFPEELCDMPSPILELRIGCDINDCICCNQCF